MYSLLSGEVTLPGHHWFIVLKSPVDIHCLLLKNELDPKKVKGTWLEKGYRIPELFKVLAVVFVSNPNPLKLGSMFTLADRYTLYSPGPRS